VERRRRRLKGKLEAKRISEASARVEISK